MRRINAAGLQLIKSFEGCKLTAYQDSVFVWTIGYGSTGPHVKPGMKITQEEADALLEKDLSRFEQGVSELVKVPIDENQFSALVSFAFNCGLGNLAKSTLLKKLNDNKPLEAAEEFLKWNKAGGAVLKGLTRRRIAEKELFLTPVR